MGRYLLLWKVDPARVPVNPQERAAMWQPMLDMVKQEMEQGLNQAWGVFVGELAGYAVLEGTEVEIGAAVQKYVPYVLFSVHPLASLEQMGEVIKAMSA
jgi:hypothetical protein